MFVYVFEGLSQVTSNWHPEGGAVVVAKDRAQARRLIDDFRDLEVTEGEWKHVVRYKTDNSAKARVFIFPDAGCC